MKADPLLQVQDLAVHFPVKKSFFGKPEAFVRAVDGVSFQIQAGETLGLVGESGCGKTTLGRAIVRLLPITAGKVIFDGVDLSHLNTASLRPHRRHFQIIFQDPYSSLDPEMTVEETLFEPLEIHRLAKSTAEKRQLVKQLLVQVGLEPSQARRKPHEFSGGQRQRIGIARALAVQPKLLVCDEPVSALDVSVRAQIVNLLKSLQEDRGISMLFVAHDLEVVEHISQRILVMYLGRVVEEGPAREVCSSPKHPYTQALISAVPVIDPEGKRARILLPGDPPSPMHPPTGCPFHPRCPVAEDRCREVRPALREIRDGRKVACHLAD